MTLALFGCDDAPQASEEQAQEQSISEHHTDERFSLLCVGRYTPYVGQQLPGESLQEWLERAQDNPPYDVELILKIDLREQTVFGSSFGTCPIRSLSAEQILFSCPEDDEAQYFTGNINRLSGSARIHQARSSAQSEWGYKLKCEGAKPRF